MRTEHTACEPTQVDADELYAEIERYLAAVETFRSEGCEPAWADDEALAASWRLEWPRGRPERRRLRALLRRDGRLTFSRPRSKVRLERIR